MDQSTFNHGKSGDTNPKGRSRSPLLALYTRSLRNEREEKIGHRTSAACGGRLRLCYTLDEGKESERETTNCPPKRVRSTSLMRQGFFPPPALPGLNGNTSPSAICADRSHPSRAERCHHGCHHDHVQRRLPLLRTSSLACVLSPLPRRNGRMRISLASPTAAAFLVIVASGLPHGIFEACTMFTNVTARTLCFPPNRGVFLKCFRPFVASWPAPSASGRSESGRVGITPTELVHLRQGTHNNTCERALKKAILHRKNALFY